MATAVLMATSGCVNSKGTLKAATGNGSPHRQAVSLSKLFPEAQVKVTLFWLALSATTLPPSGIELSSLQSSSGGAFVLCPHRLLGLVLLWQPAKRGVTPSPSPGIG